MQDKINSTKNDEKRFVEEIVAEVTADFKKRRAARLPLERKWELNVNFLNGNQYCDINARGEISQEESRFFWQSRGVYNHIAPIMESRLAKLAKVSPIIAVRPRSEDDKDVMKAGVAEKLISGAFKVNKMEEVAKEVTAWSETCGTGFYKIVWDNDGGNKIGFKNGKDVFEGEVKILPVSPFEIFPDNLYTEKIENCKSVIHAKAVGVSDIFDLYGVTVSPDCDGGIYGGAYSDKENNYPSEYALVMEKYEAPCSEFPNGRLITVAGGKLLYYGELPYLNGDNKKRTFPFVKQTSVLVSGSFFGASVIERLIPVQRAYNAVKNRKHEFLNRLSMGVMTVEDGSVDTDDLSEEGLNPGKVLVYRQGANPPEMMTDAVMPPDFTEEENKLLNEFVTISGVSDVSSSSKNASVSSGSALEILIRQDNERLVRYAETIRSCYLKVAKLALRLYSQFLSGVKAVKYQDEFDASKIVYADSSAADSDDVYAENENELIYTETQKKEMIFKLYESGLLFSEDGSVRPSVKEKILSLLGYKELDYKKGISVLQENKARKENEIIRKQGLDIEIIDDDAVHADEHIRYVLCEYDELKPDEKERLFAHIAAHKERAENTEKEKGENL